MSEHYIYYFVNEKDEVVYVGRTADIKRRINQHFGSNGHLKESEYNDVKLIKYAPLSSENEARIYETYYISKWKPTYNSVHSNGGPVNFNLPDLFFRVFELNSDKKENKLDEKRSEKEEEYMKLSQRINVIKDILADELNYNVFDDDEWVDIRKERRLYKSQVDRLEEGLENTGLISVLQEMLDEIKREVREII